MSKGKKNNKPKRNANKSGNRRGKRRAPRARLPMTFVPGPSAQRRVFCFEQVYGLTEAAAGAGAFNSFRINSIFDPDYTGVGSSALGYSTYAYLYGRYRVLSTRVLLRFVDVTAVATGGQIVGVIFNANGVFSSNPLTWPSQPFAKSTILQGNQGGEHSACTLNLTPPLHKVAGVTRSQFLADQDYSATFGSNPATPLYAHVFMTGKLSSAAESCKVEVRIIYDTELSMPLASVTV